jgi:glycosyltransferase involved in cell wall biosynthesis
MNPPGILLICDTYPPVMGGSEIEAQRVCSALLKRGYRVLVLTSGGPPMPPLTDWVDPAGVPVRILTRRTRGRGKDLWFAWRVAWTIWRERSNYQIVYFLMQGLHLATGLLVARALRRPIIMKFGGSGVIPLMRRSRAGRFELDRLCKWAARLLVLNDGMIEEAVADGLPQERITWMPNPVDVNEFRPAGPDELAPLRRRLEIPDRARVAIYVGRLSAEKGLPGLVRGFALASRADPDALLLLVGDGAQRRELEALAMECGLGPGQIRFVGRVAVSDVPLWLRASDIFVLTSPSEGFSCALAEAMSAGLPSVVTDIPANAQLVDAGMQGLLVPVGDEKQTADAILDLFRDGARRKSMGDLARRRIVDNYSLEKVADRYEKLFAEVLAYGAGGQLQGMSRSSDTT